MAEKHCTSVGKAVSNLGELASGKGAPGSPAGAEGAAGGQAAPPPITDRGVEFCFHWLTVTLWLDMLRAGEWVYGLLGISGSGLSLFEHLPQGARGFREVLIGPGGCKLYASPVAGTGYCSVELPGELVKSIPAERLRSKLLGLGCRWQPSRLDLAWDHGHYAPSDVYAALEAGQVRSLAKRETLREIREPFKGGHTVYLGSRQSERMLRVYKRDGRTRTELECKGERAKAILLDLLTVPVEQWATRALSHLRDYCDFSADWWASFCCGVERAYMTLTNWAEQSFGRTEAWLKRQVGPALAMFEEVLGPKALFRLIEDGRGRWRARHRVILAQCGASI